MTVVHEAIADDEALAIAETAGLRYVTDVLPGLRRSRCGKGFSYRRPDGTTEKRRRTLDRIRSLAVPPAWTDVWICPYPNGHLQATGRDARGRKQYRYHPQWREVRDAAKYDRLVDVGRALPRIRERVKGDPALPGMPREKVLAAVVQLLDDTLMRVGNAEYARLNESFGATTIRNEHVSVRGQTVLFTFRGKSGDTTSSRSSTSGWRGSLADARRYPDRSCSPTLTTTARHAMLDPRTSTSICARLPWTIG